MLKSYLLKSLTFVVIMRLLPDTCNGIIDSLKSGSKNLILEEHPSLSTYVYNISEGIKSIMEIHQRFHVMSSLASKKQD